MRDEIHQSSLSHFERCYHGCAQILSLFLYFLSKSIVQLFFIRKYHGSKADWIWPCSDHCVDFILFWYALLVSNGLMYMYKFTWSKRTKIGQNIVKKIWRWHMIDTIVFCPSSPCSNSSKQITYSFPSCPRHLLQYST